MLRWSVVATGLALLATGCTTTQQPTAHQTPTPASPPATRLSTVPRATDTPTPAAFRYLAQDIELALPAAFAGHKLERSLYPYPGEPDPPPHRRDPLAAHPQVSPEICRDVIRTLGVPGDPGDFIAPTTPSARAFTPLPASTANSTPFVNVVAVEVSPALGDRLLDQRLPPPPECASIQVDGKPQASVTERPLPGFGVRARYIVRTYPLDNAQWTERTLVYRTNSYAVLIRLDAHTNPENPFLDFARQTRDRLAGGLKG